MEDWKDIKGYEGLYQISNYGNVRSLDRLRKTHANGVAKIKGKKLKKVVANTGYYVVNLRKNNASNVVNIHRLVAEAFIENKGNKKCVHHKDENKLNNNVHNLMWVTHKQNSNLGTMPQRAKENATKHRFLLNGKYLTLREISENTKIPFSTLYSRIFTYQIPFNEAITVKPNHGNKFNEKRYYNGLVKL